MQDKTRLKVSLKWKLLLLTSYYVLLVQTNIIKTTSDREISGNEIEPLNVTHNMEMNPLGEIAGSSTDESDYSAPDSDTKGSELSLSSPEDGNEEIDETNGTTDMKAKSINISPGIIDSSNQDKQTIPSCPNVDQDGLPTKGTRVAFTILLYIIILPFGLIGNTSTLYVMLVKKSQLSIIDIFIANLALSDILLCAFGVPVAPFYTLYYGYWIFSREFCKLYAFTLSMSVYVSTLTMMCIAYYRYQLILYPHGSVMDKKKSYELCISTWLSALLITMPFILHVDTHPPNCSISYCDEEWYPPFQRFHFSLVTLTLQFFFPLITSSYLYGHIFRYLFVQEQKRKARSELSSNAFKNSTSLTPRNELKARASSLVLSDERRRKKLLVRRFTFLLKHHEQQRQQQQQDPQSIIEAKRNNWNEESHQPDLRAQMPPVKFAPYITSSYPRISKNKQDRTGEIRSSTWIMERPASSMGVTFLLSDGSRENLPRDDRAKLPLAQLGSNFTGISEFEVNSSELDHETSFGNDYLATDQATTSSVEPTLRANKPLRVTSSRPLKRTRSDLTTARPAIRFQSIFENRYRASGSMSILGTSFNGKTQQRPTRVGSYGDFGGRNQVPDFVLIKEEQMRQHDRRVRKTNLKLISVVGLFALSWLPLNLFNCVVDYFLWPSDTPAMRSVFMLSQMLASMSVCYNPILYAWMSENYRRGVANALPIRLFCHLRSRKQKSGQSVVGQP